jgi:hypothetical protein
MGLFNFLGSIFKPVTELVDDLHTSEEEKLKLKNDLAKMQFDMQKKLLDHETKLMLKQADIVKAEASSKHWLTASWRPIVSLSFAAIIIARWFGLTSDSISMELELELFSILKVSLGGYIGARSGEKIVTTVMQNRNSVVDKADKLLGKSSKRTRQD